MIKIKVVDGTNLLEMKIIRELKIKDTVKNSGAPECKLCIECRFKIAKVNMFCYSLCKCIDKNTKIY